MNEKVQHQRYQVLSGYALKLVGVALMVIDHLHEMFNMFGVPLWFHMIGRACLPIFLFMVSEGFHYTRSRKKYMLRLLIGFWGMGIGNAVFSRIMPLDDVVLINNVFGTMLLSAFYMWMLETIKEGVRGKKAARVLLGIGGMVLPVVSYFVIMGSMAINPLLGQAAMVLLPCLLIVEGGFTAVLLAVLFYALRRFGRWVQTIPLAAVSILVAVFQGGFQWMMIFAAIPLLLYNGQAGKKSKWFFYIFYPAHIYIFYTISYLLH